MISIAFQCRFRALTRLSLMFLWTALMIPPGLVAMHLKGKYHSRFINFYSREMLRLMGIRLLIHGKRYDAGPALYVSNHASYLDIIVLNALLPAAFIAKEDIAHWPVIGWISKISRPIFVKREKAKTGENMEKVRETLSHRGGLILFPEGTTTDGNRVKKFNSSFFALAQESFEGKKLAVQPITLAYTRINNIPMGAYWRPHFVWYGDMELAPHVWNFLQYAKTTVEVFYHPVLQGDNDRKRLSVESHAAISRALQSAFRGDTENLPLAA